MTSSKAEGSIDGVGSKGTPPKQIFIANIPEGCEGAEQTLYGLVREVLAGFKSVPIDATLPRSIRVRGDHVFVEFSSEAFAGIFLDAYHAQPCVLKIGEEQLVAARSMQRMRTDIQLQHAVAGRFQNQALDPNNVLFLGNVPAEWQNEERLGSHLGSLLEGVMSGSSLTSTRPLSVHTFPAFSVAYVHIAGSMLADAFFLRCFSHREHMEVICTSLIICRNSTCLPSAARVSLGH